MFKCSKCKQSVGPKISPIFAPVGVREVVYTTENVEGEVVITPGTELLGEHKLCPKCADTPTPVGVEVPITTHLALGASLQEHARRCKKEIGECKLGTRAMPSYRSIPLHALSVICADKIATPFKTSVASLLVENLLARTKDETQRAARDFEASYSILKGYEVAGGRL